MAYIKYNLSICIIKITENLMSCFCIFPKHCVPCLFYMDNSPLCFIMLPFHKGPLSQEMTSAQASGLLMARCPSIFSSIAIGLNVPRDDVIELTFVNLGYGFEKAGSVFCDIGDA